MLDLDFKYPLVSKESKRLCIKANDAHANFMEATMIFNNLAKDIFPKEYEDMIRADADYINAEIDYIRHIKIIYKL
jgi:hypothetical protein